LTRREGFNLRVLFCSAGYLFALSHTAQQIAATFWFYLWLHTGFLRQAGKRTR
jgi:hypothetical protein